MDAWPGTYRAYNDPVPEDVGISIITEVSNRGIIDSESYLPVLPCPRSKLGVAALPENIFAALTS
ncbi:hypothetical protein CDL15_Pgr016898 [Punica granatum]|uniref:Uncharacterized protein n=1 Tax=Punica granatum TaxID=22663 RepID=A0A218WZ43_PUNGR|nr:hypothetical protein CDL15_Pgr016898 [Punica granatum]